MKRHEHRGGAILCKSCGRPFWEHLRDGVRVHPSGRPVQ